MCESCSGTKASSTELGCAFFLSSSSSVSSHVGELSLCVFMATSSISVNAVHHCIVTGPSPEVAYFGRAAFREGKSTFAVLAATKGGTPVGMD